MLGVVLIVSETWACKVSMVQLMILTGDAIT